MEDTECALKHPQCINVDGKPKCRCTHRNVSKPLPCSKKATNHSRCICWGLDKLHKQCFGDVRLQNITVLAVLEFEDARLQTP